MMPSYNNYYDKRLLATSRFPKLDDELKVHVALGVQVPFFAATVRRVNVKNDKELPWISANYRYLRAMDKEHAHSLVRHNEVDYPELNRVYTIAIDLEHE